MIEISIQNKYTINFKDDLYIPISKKAALDALCVIRNSSNFDG